MIPNLVLQPIKAYNQTDNNRSGTTSWPAPLPSKNCNVYCGKIIVDASKDPGKRVTVIPQNGVADVWAYGLVIIRVDYNFINMPGLASIAEARIKCRDRLDYALSNRDDSGSLEIQVYIQPWETIDGVTLDVKLEGKFESEDVIKHAYVEVQPFRPGNQPPNKPATPDGPSTVYVNQEVSFSSSTEDPDNERWGPITGPPDRIHYKWDFGDGTITDWSENWFYEGPFYSPLHIYLEEGTYLVYAKAKDEVSWTGYGRVSKESYWSNPHKVTCSKVKSGIVNISVSSDVIFDMINPDNNTSEPMETNDTIYGNITGYFIDIDGDGIWDLFHITNITFPDNVVDINQIYFNQTYQTDYDSENHTYNMDFNNDGTTDASVDEEDIPEPQPNNA